MSDLLHPGPEVSENIVKVVGVLGAVGLTDEVLRHMLGDELAHRFDYADWQFPAWTLETLLQTVNGPSSRRKVQYDDEAALLLAEYCIRTRGGVRAFDNLESALLRQQHGRGLDRIDVAMAKALLAKRGVAV